MSLPTDYRIAREARKIQQLQSEKEIILALLKNPVFEIVAGYVLIETLQKAELMPSLAGTIAEGGILTAVAFQQLAPILPDLLKATTEGIGMVTEGIGMVAKAIPMLARAGG